MARRTEYNGATKAVAATTAQVLTFSNTDLQSERVIAYHVAFSGTNNDLGALTRIRLFANGQPIISCTPAQLIAWLDSISGGRIQLALADTTFTLPLMLLDMPTPDQQDVCQFPMSSNVQLELTTDNSTGAGTCLVGWTESNVAPQLYPKYLSQQLNIDASSNSARYPFQENGIVRGVCYPRAGVDQERIVIAGQTAKHATGPAFIGGTYGDLGAEEEKALYGAGQTFATQILNRVSLALPATAQGSYVELTTGSGWGGATNEAAIYAIAPQAAGN